MERHLLVISVDAMVYEDLEYAATLPHFGRLLSGCATVERVRSTYPSLTHTAHATIMCGAAPERTGVINNTVFNPRDPKNGGSVWFNDLSQLGCESILHAAKRAGLTTAASTWPMTSHGEDVIDYLVPNALNGDFQGREDDPLSVFRALGAGDCVMDIIEEGVRRFGWKNEHPAVDDFQIFCAAEIIKRYRPNLILTHPSYVDSMRHAHGVFGEHVYVALRETDRWLGMLLDALEEAGIADATDVILLSDHGQIDIARVISPNVYLVDSGDIKLDGAGNITEWSAYVKSAGGSAQVFLHDPTDTHLQERIYQRLSHMAEEKLYGFTRVLTREEARAEYGLCGDFSFVLEGDGYTGFGEQLVRPAVRNIERSDYRTAHGTHGHDPDRGPQPTFLGKGPSFRAGVRVARGELLNHAPTMAAVLGISLPSADGCAVRELLND